MTGPVAGRPIRPYGRYVGRTNRGNLPMAEMRTTYV